MSLSLLPRLGFDRTSRAPSRPSQPDSFRPQMEALEDRVVLASPGSITLPLAVQSLTQVGDQLQAVISLAGQTAGQVLMDVGAQLAPGQDASILNLHLEDIHLNLLGLHVDTSPICLDVTAHGGEGLLGDLLSGLGSGLNLGDTLDLGGILDKLGNDATAFLGGVDSLLDQVFSQPLGVTGLLGGHQNGVCNILNLELGPIDLNLLGLEVALDNCDDPPGPITVDVTAHEGEGLLGDLLCGLTGGVDVGGNTGGLLDRIDGLIGRLDDLLTGLDQVSGLTDRLEGIIDQLGNIDSQHDLDRVLNRLDKVIDNLDDPNKLDKALDQLEKTLDQLAGGNNGNGNHGNGNHGNGNHGNGK